MAVVAATVAVISFDKFGTELADITHSKLPPMFSAQQLATDSAKIVAIAPRIIASKTPTKNRLSKQNLIRCWPGLTKMSRNCAKQIFKPKFSMVLIPTVPICAKRWKICMQ